MSVFKPNPNLDFSYVYRAKDDPLLNKYQRDHIDGLMSVYKPILFDNGDKLPPLSYQWSQDWKRRSK
jgi:hypothetical protein